MTPPLSATQVAVLRELERPGVLAYYDGKDGDWIVSGRICSRSVRFLLDNMFVEEVYGNAMISKRGRAALAAIDAAKEPK